MLLIRVSMTIWQLPVPIKSDLKERFEFCDVSGSLKFISYRLSIRKIRGFTVRDHLAVGKTSNDNSILVLLTFRFSYVIVFNPCIEYRISFTPVPFVQGFICSMSPSNWSIFEQPERMRVSNDAN
jgi:hypothetical protein